MPEPYKKFDPPAGDATGIAAKVTVEFGDEEWDALIPETKMFHLDGTDRDSAVAIILEIAQDLATSPTSR